MPLGASILDLLPIPPGTQSAIPSGLRSFLENFAAVDLTSSTTTGATFHYGVLWPIVADTGIADVIRGWSIEGAGFDRGVRFQLATTRAPTLNNIEPQPSNLQLDLFLEQVSIVVPALKAALLMPGGGTTPAHLLPDPASSEVRLVGNAILRIINGPPGWAGPFLVDMPDPLVPGTPTGAVASMQFVPPHFFIANSAIGLTVRKLTFDASGIYTPADIMARNHGPDWTGIAINEALLYLPRETPLVGSLVLGVRDVLLGDPFGMQGEVRVEWGADAVTATDVEISQALGDADDRFESITQEWPDGEQDRTVTIQPERPLRFFAQVTAGSGSTVRWILPDGSTATGLVTPEFRARAGDTLVCVRSEVPEGSTTPVEGPEIRHHFRAAAATTANKITVSHAAQTHVNAVHVSGSRETIVAAGLVFSVEPPPTDPADSGALVWQLGDGPTAQLASGASFTLNSPAGLPAAGRADLVLSDGSGGERRVRIQCLDGASLLIGAGQGVFDAQGASLAVQAVERTVVLNQFHDDGSLAPADQPATRSSDGLSVPVNAMAQVTVGVDEPATPQPGRHVRVRMVFDEANPSHQGEDIEAVEQLLADFPGRRLVLIGRCDDVGDGSYNEQLARERAAALREQLIALGVAADLIIYRGEQDDPATGWVGLGDEPDQEFLGVPEGQRGTEWYAWEQEEPNHPLPNTSGESGDLRVRREEYRRVDIYAEADVAIGEPVGNNFASTLRRAWVPGEDGESAVLPVTTTPALIHRVSVRVAWDSPTATTLADFVPTLAEVTVAYENGRLTELATEPKDDDNQSALGDAEFDADPAEVLTVTGRWTYDARSGETLFAASVDSTGDPLGLFAIDGDAVALAAAFGPAVVATVSPAFDGAGAVGIVAVAGAALILQSAVKDGRVVCTGLAIEHKQRALDTLAGSEQKMLFDYESSFNVDLNVLNVLQLSTSKPIKIRYRDVGIQLNWSESNWWEIASFVYEGISMEVVEPGQWEISGPLGKFLGIVAVRMGTGSTWFEVDMVLNLDLGVVRLTSATIRIVAESGKPLGVEIRGLGVAVSIPGVLEGSGTASIQSDGSVAATLDVDVVAAGLSARAELELKPAFSYVAISVTVILPVGIPLANSGLGIFGFVGQFVSNGQRTIEVDPTVDPVQAELDWYVELFAAKWEPRNGQWALGLGVIIGTLPDMAFTFNAQGMFVVTFPDPSVILGIDAKLLASPGQATQEGSLPDTEIRLIGLTVIDPDAVMIGVRGTYSIPGVLEFNVPLSAYFPLAGGSGAARGSYVHLGADNIVDSTKVGIFPRAGDPVSMTLLPGLLDANAWAYFMLEERELHWLGNDERFSFDGFSVGFGAGWTLSWEGGPVTLDASATVLVGLGTSPFKLVGGAEVDGTIKCLLGSASVEGELLVEVIDTGASLSKHLAGEFCAEIDLAFAPSVRKCVEIDIGGKLTDNIPVPQHPLRGVDLTDRRGSRVAVATTGTPGDDHTVWPDTVPVLGFSHVPEIGAGLEDAWRLAARPNNPTPWAGTSEFKYAFRLDAVVLTPNPDAASEDAGDGKLDAVFWLPTHRGGVMTGAEDEVWPSEHEGAALALLSWVPFTVFRNLTNGGEGLPADPAATLGEICTTVTIGHQTCAPGLDAKPIEPGRVSIRSRRGEGDPVAALFTVFGTASLGGLSWRECGPALAGLGLHAMAEGIVDLALPVTLPDGRRVRRGYELPGIGQAGARYASMGWEGRFEPAIASGQVLLEVCDQGFGVSAPTRCFPFDDVDKVEDVDRWDTAGLRIVKTSTPRGGIRLTGLDGLLVVGSGTIRIIFPFPVSWAALAIVHPLNVATMTIKGLRGHVLDTRVIPRGSEVQTVVIENLGPFAEIVIVSLDMRLGIAAVCVRPGLGPADGPLAAPPLVGQRMSGELALWDAEIQADQILPGGRRCLQVMYTSPDALGWQAIGVPAMQSATIRLVGVCGLTTALKEVRARDQAARDTLIDGWNLKAGQLQQTRPLLAAGTNYTLSVTMSWAGWRPASPGAQPPATVSSWTEFSDPVEYRFRTASETADTSATPPAVSLTAESIFDPRAVARYLLGFEPVNANAPPHLLNDALLARFAVDHVEQLLAVYNRALVLTLRRTDPPAGSVVNGPLPEIALEVVRGPLEPRFMNRVDERVLQAVQADAPCLDNNVNTGGVTLSISAELEPNAQYDLMLFAPPSNDQSDESLLIARTHFRSSRYADVNEMLAALGFGPDGERASFIPFDFVVANGATMPLPVASASDAVLEEALRVLGMDPWPVIGTGRTVAIWRPGSDPGDYLLAGLLLESPEPIERGERCGVLQALVTGGTNAVTLTPSRANTAGTRVLLSTASVEGQALDGDNLTLELTLRDRLTTRTGTRALRSRPRIAYQELL